MKQVQRVARIMKAMELRSIISGKFKVCTTYSNHGFSISENILDKNFTLKGPSGYGIGQYLYQDKTGAL
jgi:hypothetical protein